MVETIPIPQWLMERLGEISRKSSLADAIRYTLGHWEGLTLDPLRLKPLRWARRGRQQHGRAEHPSDPVGTEERVVRGVRQRRRTLGHSRSLINTAKLHDIDLQTYLADVLDRMVSGRTKVNTLRELLPWNWRAARNAAAPGPAAAA